jgi:hypothetical protein
MRRSFEGLNLDGYEFWFITEESYLKWLGRPIFFQEKNTIYGAQKGQENNFSRS